MSDAVGRPSGQGRFNLNQDITKALDTLGKVDYAQVLRAHFPARNITPGEYARLHPVRRRVRCQYVGPKDPIPTTCPRGWDLLVLIGVGFTRRETEDVITNLEAARTSERVLVGVPLQPLPGSAQFKEVAVLDYLAQAETYKQEGPAREALQVRQASLRKSLLERVRKALQPAAFRWLHEGRVLEESPAGSRNAFFSSVLETLFPELPRLSLSGSSRLQRQALDELLDLSTPLQLPVVLGHGSARVLRRALADQGLLEVESDRGSYISYSVAGPMSDGRPLAAAWNRLLGMVMESGDHNASISLADLVSALRQRPLGLRGGLVPLMIGAALRRYYPDLELVEEGEAVPTSGMALRRALARPQNWSLQFHPTSQDEGQFLAGLLAGFGPGEASSSPGGPNLWELTRQAMLDWRSRLPAVARATRSWPSQAAQALMELLADPVRTASARDMLGLHLPELFGESGIPLAQLQDALLAQIDRARAEMDGFLALRQRQIMAGIARVLGRDEAPDALTEEEFDGLVRGWLGGLHPGTSARPFSDWATGLREVARSSAPFAERWFEVLPHRLGLPPLTEWTPEEEPVFLSRLARARLELELWRLRELFPLPQDPRRRTDEVRRWLREAMDGAGLELGQRESLILDLLDSLVWK